MSNLSKNGSRKNLLEMSTGFNQFSSNQLTGKPSKNLDKSLSLEKKTAFLLYKSHSAAKSKPQMCEKLSQQSLNLVKDRFFNSRGSYKDILQTKTNFLEKIKENEKTMFMSNKRGFNRLAETSTDFGFKNNTTNSPNILRKDKLFDPNPKRNTFQSSIKEKFNSIINSKKTFKYKEFTKITQFQNENNFNQNSTK